MSDPDVKFHHIGVGSVNDGADSPVVQHLYEEGYVFCHYEDVISFDPTEYEGSTGDMEAMISSIRDNSPYLCYVRLASGHGNDGTRQLGKLSPNTEPRIIGAREAPEENAETTVEGFELLEFTEFELDTAKEQLDPNEWKIYKGAQLTAVKQLSPEEHTGLNEVPSTTWSNWDPADQIYDLYDGNDLNPQDPASYSPPQTERLCEEFLRHEKPNYCSLMEPGGQNGTDDFDLLGYAGDTRIIGEVKNRTSAPSKDDLHAVVEQSQDPGTEAYLFTRTLPETDYPNVTVVSLDTVIETLYENQRTANIMDRMVSYGSS